ncbi:MAG: fibronectin type III domain-containing protein [Prolixibacteraceae bacterium]
MSHEFKNSVLFSVVICRNLFLILLITWNIEANSQTACTSADKISVGNITATTARITYSLPSNISSALLEVRTSNNQNWQPVSLSINSTSVEIRDLYASTKYTFRIKTVCTDNPTLNTILYSTIGTFTTTNNQIAVVEISAPNTKSPGNLTVSCYPNPASNELSFKISGVSGEMVELKMSNIYGLNVFQGRFPENTIQKIDVQSYPRGIYVIKISQAGMTNSIKVALK